MKEWAEELPSDTVRIDRALLGIPIQLFCKKGEVAGAIRRATESWDTLADRAASPVSIELEFKEGPDGTAPPAIEAQVDQLTIQGLGTRCNADARRRFAECTLANSWLEQPSELVALVLEPTILFLLTRCGRAPIHASGILIGDHAILFAGKSGSGKSSLALAAHRAGLQVLSEDTVYIQSEPNFAVWGWQGPVHLLPEDSSNYAAKVRVRNGRIKHAVYLDGDSESARSAASATLCILARDAEVSISALDETRAKALLRPLEPGFDLVRSQVYAAQDHLCRRGVWLLRLSSCPRAAIDLVISRVEELVGDNAL